MRSLLAILTLLTITACTPPVIKQDVIAYSESFEALKEASLGFYRRYEEGARKRAGVAGGTSVTTTVDLNRHRTWSEVALEPGEFIADGSGTYATIGQTVEVRSRALDAVSGYNTALLALVDGAPNEQLRAEINMLGLALDSVGRAVNIVPYISQTKVILEAAVDAAGSALDRKKVTDALLAENEGFTVHSPYCTNKKPGNPPSPSGADPQSAETSTDVTSVPKGHPVIQILAMLRIESGCLLKDEYDEAGKHYLDQVKIYYKSQSTPAAKAEANAQAIVITRDWVTYAESLRAYRAQLNAVQQQFERLRDQAQNPSADFLAAQAIASARDVYRESIRIQAKLDGIGSGGNQ
jgi:hypothetical protein